GDGRGGGRAPTLGAKLRAARGIATVAFALGGAAGAGLHAVLTTSPPPIVIVDRPPAAPPAISSASSPATTAAPSAAPPARDAVAPAAPPATEAPKARPSPIGAERRLLDEARAALVQGDPQAALERLGAAKRVVPRPVLVEERDALLVEALVAAHRPEEARA